MEVFPIMSDRPTDLTKKTDMRVLREVSLAIMFIHTLKRIAGKGVRLVMLI